MDIRIKRIYEPPSADDGRRILVDRLWPRGLKKTEVQIDHWLRDLAPSNELRKWYGHEPSKWSDFKQRYFAELEARAEIVQTLLGYVHSGRVTFLFGSKEERLNNAAALKEYVESRPNEWSSELLV